MSAAQHENIVVAFCKLFLGNLIAWFSNVNFLGDTMSQCHKVGRTSSQMATGSVSLPFPLLLALGGASHKSRVLPVIHVSPAFLSTCSVQGASGQGVKLEG